MFNLLVLILFVLFVGVTISFLLIYYLLKSLSYYDSKISYYQSKLDDFILESGKIRDKHPTKQISCIWHNKKGDKIVLVECDNTKILKFESFTQQNDKIIKEKFTYNELKEYNPRLSESLDFRI